MSIRRWAERATDAPDAPALISAARAWTCTDVASEIADRSARWRSAPLADLRDAARRARGRSLRVALARPHRTRHARLARADGARSIARSRRSSPAIRARHLARRGRVSDERARARDRRRHAHPSDVRA